MSVNPTREQLAAVAAVAGTEADGPLVMLNLNRYRERAAYEADPPEEGPRDVSRSAKPTSVTARRPSRSSCAWAARSAGTPTRG